MFLNSNRTNKNRLNKIIKQSEINYLNNDIYNFILNKFVNTKKINFNSLYIKNYKKKLTYFDDNIYDINLVKKQNILICSNNIIDLSKNINILKIKILEIDNNDIKNFNIGFSSPNTHLIYSITVKVNDIISITIFKNKFKNTCVKYKRNEDEIKYTYSNTVGDIDIKQLLNSFELFKYYIEYKGKRLKFQIL